VAGPLRSRRTTGLVDQSRAPKHCPHRTADRITKLLVECRQLHPQWGARKPIRVLRGRHTEIRAWPAPSTVADLLARRGLVHKRRRRRPPVHPGVVRPTTVAPNDLWTADFKGQFRTGDHRYCYPLTMADQHRRFTGCRISTCGGCS